MLDAELREVAENRKKEREKPYNGLVYYQRKTN